MIYIGTYTEWDSEGIYGYQINAETGKLESHGLLAKQGNPSYLMVNDRKDRLYSVSEYHETSEGRRAAICAYEVMKDGGLRLMNQMLCPGSDPCHLTLWEEQSLLFTANYSDGSLSVYRLREDGSVEGLIQQIQHEGRGFDPNRQEGPHVHFVQRIPGENKLAVIDLGLDGIFFYEPERRGDCYQFNENSSFRIKAPEGSGPRHLAFGKADNLKYGSLLYVVYELSSEVSVYYQGQCIQKISTLPAGYEGCNTCSAIKTSKNGRFVYAANRGHDSIAVFMADKSTGTLELQQIIATAGRNPRDFSLDPSGQWLIVANQDSHLLTVFAVDIETGLLTKTEETAKLSMPVCICFGNE